MRASLLLVPCLLAAQPDPRQLLRDSIGAIREYKSYQIKSTVSVMMHGGRIESDLEMPSTVSVRRPDRMRVESTSQAGSFTIVSDGEHTWILLTPLNEYIQRDAAALPEDTTRGGMLPGGLPNISRFEKSVKIDGEQILKVGPDRIPCWIVETAYDTIELPDQGMTARDGVQRAWISKLHHVNLQTTFHAILDLSGAAVPVNLTESTRTTSIRFNPDLPDSLFAFTPPAGATQTDDWTLPGMQKPAVIGKPAPDLKTKSLDGADFDLSARKGKVVLLDFWAVWCEPCKRELPVLQKLDHEFHDQGLAVVGVNIDDENSAIEKFLKSFGIPYTIVSLPSTHDLISSLAVNAFPTVVLIDRDGNIASYEVGARGEAALRADLRELGLGAGATK